ncbi:MAG: helical backbone metal receptor [Acidimicrobiales bacterium]
MRVVSLVPSVTETLLAWGVDVVACTRFCEQPSLRHVGGTKDPDLAAIAELAPDLVVLDREENRRDDAEALVAAGLRIHVTHVVDLAGVAATLDELADSVGVPARSLHLPPPAEPSGEVAVLIWRRPWMALGAATYGSAVLDHLGLRNVLTRADGSYPALELDELAARRPSTVLLPSEPYPFAERHVAEVADAFGHPPARVVLVDGRDLFWWGVRTPDALSRLAAGLAPST